MRLLKIKKTRLVLIAAFFGVLTAGPAVVFSGDYGNKSNSLDRVIVGFDYELNYATRAYSDVQAKGGDIIGELGIIDALVLEIPKHARLNLENMPNVKYVEEDGMVTIMQEDVSATGNGQEIDWGVERIEAPDTWDANAGEGVNVAVLDTGIDLNHPDLDVAGSVNCHGVLGCSGDGDDDRGHGTHVAGTIAALDNDIGVVGVAHESNLYGVKVLDDDGKGSISNIVDGIEWAINNDIDVVNMSLGTDFDFESLKEAVNEAYNEGLALIAAAGNIDFDPDQGGWQTWQYDLRIYPAAYENVIAVAATDGNDELPTFSQRGDFVDIAAPGVNINSTEMGGGYTTSNGTSMAAPHVAGVAALVMYTGNFNNQEVYDRLIENAESVSGLDYPMVNALNSVVFTEADFKVNPSGEAKKGEKVTIDGSASTSARGNLTYDWLIEGNDTGEVLNSEDADNVIEHTFNDIDTYTITLTVTDEDGGVDSTSAALNVAESPSISKNPFYRLYNPQTGAHFYTTNFEEAMMAVDRWNFQYEGRMGSLLASSSPESTNNLYRLYNPQTGAHFYTTNHSEAMNAVNRWDFQYEGHMGRLYKNNASGRDSVYRTYNPQTGAHFYTTSHSEAMNAVDRWDFQYEGRMGYLAE